MSVSDRSADSPPPERLSAGVLIRLTGALVALAAGAAAVVIVILLVRSVLAI